MLPITIFLLAACTRNQRVIVPSNNLEEEGMETEFIAVDFNELSEFFQSFFQGFDPVHIYNFHYADVTTQNIILPAPTDPRIQGFFNITEEAWDDYVNDDDLWESNSEDSLTKFRVGVAPDVFAVDSSQLNWMRSNSFFKRHRGERIAGHFLVCKENRLVWFHIGRN